ncbi:TonB-dependent receptor plug domain-containing protein [Lutibacter sp. A80]|uniref:TonB-dependent receptor plug domain-containing protein n=1 Tax=Lutibacter sp. A80 TaxID=2918453 RepID=UPI001F0644A5|nr:TonB-dependent receptor plug domain-containing protein [Lutibacter sp. A80]UMB62004.1 TonB-dependent receptor plug domain-containing protein [Lutibacter sp. A80]
MKNYIKLTVLLLVFTIYSPTIFSQTKIKKNTLSGYVKDVNGNVVKDVVFFIDEVKIKSKINNYGTYKLKVNSNTKKVKAFSYSRGVIEIDYNGQKKIDFIYNNFRPSATPQTTVKRDNNTFEYKNIFEMIRAKIPGVRVQSDNTILIRGTSSINASTSPLFVVDGSPVSSITNISPQFVENISVLKGPETAIYGVRGSNGVILITLKKKI